MRSTKCSLSGSLPPSFPACLAFILTAVLSFSAACLAASGFLVRAGRR